MTYDIPEFRLTAKGDLFMGERAAHTAAASIPDDTSPDDTAAPALRSFQLQATAVQISNGAALSRSRSRSRSLSRSRSRSRSTTFVQAPGTDTEGGVTLGNAIWEELRELTLSRFPFDRPGALPWEILPLPLPPGPEHTQKEVLDLLYKEAALASDPLRQAEIVDQVSSARYSEILHPLGITDPANAPATAALIDTVLNMTERVGYVYKRKFGRARPNQVATHLRPFLGNPAHESYPSNHSFQMFSVAEVMTRLMPELPATVELFHVAQRVAENREMAGIHYASDSMAGRELARMFAPYLIYACRRLMRDALSEWGA